MNEYILLGLEEIINLLNTVKYQLKIINEHLERIENNADQTQPK